MQAVAMKDPEIKNEMRTAANLKTYALTGYYFCSACERIVDADTDTFPYLSCAWCGAANPTWNKPIDTSEKI